MKRLNWLLNKSRYFIILIVVFWVVIILNPDKTSEISFKDLVHFILQTILMYGIIAYLNRYKYLKYGFILFIILSLSTVLTYKSFPSAGIIMSVLNSSSSEAYDFIKFNLLDILIIFILFFGLIFAPISKNKILNRSCMFVGLLYLVIPSIIFAFSSKNIPEYSMLSGTARGMTVFSTKVEYFYSDEMANRFPAFKTIKGLVDSLKFSETINQASASSWTEVEASNDSSNLLIIGLGESLRADHLGIYGYRRNTTPLLSALKQDLYIYKNAYSGGPNTWTSIPSMFTKFNKKPQLSKSIISLANDAGYETYWLSNQSKVGNWVFSVSSIALQSKYAFFTTNGSKHEIKYDSELLPKLISILKNRDVNDKTLIVLHFYGSHMYFKDRYPKKYSKYHGGDSGLEKDINEYDNSVLFTDYILSQVLKISNEYNAKFIYMSDHGLGNTNGDLALKHDVRNKPEIDSMHVPLISNTNLHLSDPISLFYFECVFSEWSGITAAELNDSYCNSALQSKNIVFYAASLNLEKVKWGSNDASSLSVKMPKKP